MQTSRKDALALFHAQPLFNAADYSHFYSNILIQGRFKMSAGK